jgi:hypothetical protein
MTLEDDPSTACLECIERVHFCEKLLRQLHASIITVDEFDYNAAIHLLTLCGVCMGSYLTSLPDAIAVQFGDYIEALVKSEGSMPLVRPFVVDFNSEQEVRLRKQSIEPKIERLRKATKERTADLG